MARTPESVDELLKQCNYKTSDIIYDKGYAPWEYIRDQSCRDVDMQTSIFIPSFKKFTGTEFFMVDESLLEKIILSICIILIIYCICHWGIFINWLKNML